MSTASSIFDGVIKHSIKSVFDGINEKTEEFRHSFDLLKKFQKRHSQKLVHTVSKIQVLGMRGAIPLIDLYVPTRLSDKIRRDVFIDNEHALVDLSTISKDNNSEIDIFPYLKKGGGILIQGGPGAGKTIFLSAYVMGLLGKCSLIRDKVTTSFLPLYFTLRDSPEPASDLRTLIKQYLRDIDEPASFPFIERMMNRGDICLIFDGLDEIPPDNQNLWKSAIAHLRKLFPNVLVLVSCRSGSLTIDFNDFTHFEILPFTKSDSKKFIESWFGESKEETAASLHKDLRDHPRIDDLTATPLLLSLLCNLYENDLELSTNRTDLYSRCIEVLMVRWDTSRGFKRTTSFQELSLSKRRRIFGLVGFHLSESRYMLLSEMSALAIVGKYIEQYDLEPDQASGVLKEMEGHHGLLVKPAANYWCFAHKSLQDFFAAEYIRNNATQIDFLRENWHDSSKWEVLTFVATMLENGDIFVNRLMELCEPSKLTSFPALGKRIRGAILLIKCLNQGVSLSREARERAYHFLAHVVETTVEALAKTFVFPHGFLYENRLHISYYYYKGKQRSSTNSIFRPLAQLVAEINNIKSKGLDSILQSRAQKAAQISAKLLLAAAGFERNPRFMHNVYENMRSSKDNYVYGKKIGEVADSIKIYLDSQK